MSLRLTKAIFIGLVLGIIFGLIIPGRLEWALPAVNLVSTIYMNALRMMIYPLVFCSLVVGIKGIGSIGETGRIGGQALLFFILTTLFASLLGLFLPRALGMGEGVVIEMSDKVVEITKFTSILDTLANLIPSNPFTAFSTGNMLQVLVFAIIVGIACLSIGEKAEPFLRLTESINEICIKIVSVVMLFTPIGVFSSISAVVYANGTSTIAALATVMAAVYVTYILYVLIVYGGIVRFIGKMSIKNFFVTVMPAALTGIQHPDWSSR